MSHPEYEVVIINPQGQDSDILRRHTLVSEAYHSADGYNRRAHEGWRAVVRPLKLSVIGLIWNDGNVLAVCRRGRPGDLCLPGGKVNEGELPESALPREIEEETGLIVSTFEAMYGAPSSDPGFWVKLYLVHKYSGVARQVEEGIEPQWVPFARLCEPSNTLHKFYVEFDRWLGQRIVPNSHGR